MTIIIPLMLRSNGYPRVVSGPTSLVARARMTACRWSCSGLYIQVCDRALRGGSQANLGKVSRRMIQSSRDGFMTCSTTNKWLGKIRSSARLQGATHARRHGSYHHNNIDACLTPVRTRGRSRGDNKRYISAGNRATHHH